MMPSASLNASPAPAPLVVTLKRVDSTQRVAFALAADGALDGTVVVADVQTAGRGRHGRVWEATSGTSLLASIVRRPRLPVARWPLLSLVTAVAVAEALEQTAGLPTRLKWPNDVLAGDRKLAGILLESRLWPAPVVVIGVGINLSQRRFAGPLASRATSVFLETGRVLDRDTALPAVVSALGAWHGRLETEGFERARARWLALNDTLGRVVEVDGTVGTAVDLDHDGALVLDTGVARRRVWAGETRAGGEADDAPRH
jgi:BirA family transcriptional regulator, biotin operon repressor / biotin---[acetyl-CoA-carboxylase] ligase